jgi:hypothetical protein
MKRPGYLAGYEGMVPRKIRQRIGFSYFGGKGTYAPPPAPPPKQVKTLTEAIDKKTNKYYVQDTRCPEGEKMTEVREPCQGADCDPGEIDVYNECRDDPNYLEFPEPTAGDWQYCQDVKNVFRQRGIPASFAMDFCKKEGLKEKPSKVPTPAPAKAVSAPTKTAKLSAKPEAPPGFAKKVLDWLVGLVGREKVEEMLEE